MLDHILTVALMSFVQALIEPIRDFIKYIVTYITNMSMTRWQTDNQIDITLEMYHTDRGPVYLKGEHINLTIISSIVDHIRMQNVNMKNSVVKYVNKNICVVPLDEIIFGDFKIKYKNSHNLLGKNMIETISMTIRSTQPIEAIREFVEKCYNTHMDFIKRDTNKYIYYQVDKPIAASFSRYKSVSQTTFDNLYFKGKEELLTAINKYKSGSLKKLNLLLHGVPGCGKTSIIKALANAMNKHIVVLKLSCMKSDAALMDALHLDTIFVGNLPTTLSSNDAIYILEDIDVELKKVLKPRKSIESSPIKPTKKDTDNSNNTNNTTATKPTEVTDQLTLSGILNAFDGVAEFNSILVATTNHPENLDPAFTRHGRFNMKLELGPLSSTDAINMVKYKYPEFNGEISDKSITPATLQSYLDVTDSLEELLKVVNSGEL